MGVNTILIADSNFLVRQGLRSIFEDMPEYKVVGDTDDFSELNAIMARLKPQVLIIGLNVQNVIGSEIIKHVLKEFPHQKIIVVDTKEDVNEIITILRMGVQGYILKQCDRGEILEAIRNVVHGKTFFCSNVIRLNKSASGGKEIVLSERELQVLSLISEGLTNNEIADKIFLSSHTIASHRKSLMKKFEAGNNVDLVIKAVKEKFIIP
jgi:DNA-binding NarL/FixJ family response regulator